MVTPILLARGPLTSKNLQQPTKRLAIHQAQTKLLQHKEPVVRSHILSNKAKQMTVNGARLVSRFHFVTGIVNAIRESRLNGNRRFHCCPDKEHTRPKIPATNGIKVSYSARSSLLQQCSPTLSFFASVLLLHFSTSLLHFRALSSFSSFVNLCRSEISFHHAPLSSNPATLHSRSIHSHIAMYLRRQQTRIP